jgi:hypothetical protein
MGRTKANTSIGEQVVSGRLVNHSGGDGNYEEKIPMESSLSYLVQQE